MNITAVCNLSFPVFAKTSSFKFIFFFGLILKPCSSVLAGLKYYAALSMDRIRVNPVRPSVCSSVCPSVRLSVCPSVCSSRASDLLEMGKPYKLLI